MSDDGPDATAVDVDNASDCENASDGEEGSDDEGRSDGDTFGVGIHVTSEEFQFVVHVPSAIDSGWNDPDEFQRLIEQVTWETLDQQETLRAVARTTDEGETATLGTVTMRPDGDVVDRSLAVPGE
ncbi:hypothetical protein [Halobaculum magnesiiphilum]|uniref:DUF8124 domain-containing protein n=1 Tax=Halobaculum magnesiiphilum TaxID=1017351 RepID=A0A8T8WE04_9EURY|nr:hypothetical protein [Halobaculum magnesiiphilum]QZP38016.1 hypothetical protein K6T50_02285 [Halobaculum magnesiiphilum]